VVLGLVQAQVQELDLEMVALEQVRAQAQVQELDLEMVALEQVRAQAQVQELDQVMEALDLVQAQALVLDQDQVVLLFLPQIVLQDIKDQVLALNASKILLSLPLVCQMVPALPALLRRALTLNVLRQLYSRFDEIIRVLLN
jgi:hypothetical protein